tara:strand:- start:139 stop:852 length:714 start_codon:yes stop_codon:yes gene_type:complete
MIPSRMASSRFPGKPMVKINGKPMIQRVWQQAINSNVGDVVVACSENEVFELITNLGGKAILTNPNLPSGTDRIYSALIQMPKHNEYDFVINLQGDMPLIKPNQIKKVTNPLRHNYSIGTLATNLKKNEINNQNVTKVSVKWDKNNIGQAKEFFRYKEKIEENTFHHVGIYSYTIKSIIDFVKLPTSKNEKLLNLEQYRAMDAGIEIGVTLENNIPPSIDTKEDLNLIETIIRENNE